MRLSGGRAAQVRRVVRLLRWFFRREPIVADMTAENLEPFRTWIYAAESYFADRIDRKTIVEAYIGICRYLGSMRPYGKVRGRPARPLGDAEGTLWHLCTTRYFKAKVTIREQKTIHQYKIAMCDFEQALGHPPTLADLNDEAIVGMMKMLLARGVGEKTVNERRGRLRALWEWCARKRLVEQFPDVPRVSVPGRTPKAWTKAELDRLFAACQETPGVIASGILAADWWTGLHLVLWDTGARIGEILAARWEWLDFASGLLEVPYTARKMRTCDKTYRLRAATLDVLRRIQFAGCDLVFPWVGDRSLIYSAYGAILKRAGLPHGRKDKFHKMRKSVASHLAAAGVDACAALGHSSPDVTKKSYLDPAIVGVIGPADVLPALGTGEPPRLAGPPLLLEYRGQSPEAPEPPDMAALAWL